MTSYSAEKPFASAANQNKHDILSVLTAELVAGDHVLEIGSGTGQHLCFFAEQLPQVIWQPTELPAMLAGVELWRAEAGCTNLLPPIELDVRTQPWPELAGSKLAGPDFEASVCYTANTFHIVSEAAIAAIFSGCSAMLSSGGRLIVYGPFQFGGKFDAQSNARFDQSLRQADPDSGVRDMHELNKLAAASSFKPARIISMPVNNVIAIWERS